MGIATLIFFGWPEMVAAIVMIAAATVKIWRGNEDQA